MSRYSIERQWERAHDELDKLWKAGAISRREYKRQARELNRELQDAIDAEVQERQREIEEEYYSW